MTVTNMLGVRQTGSATDALASNEEQNVHRLKKTNIGYVDK